MTIDHIQFFHCDECGERFRGDGQRGVASRVLCEPCRDRLSAEAAQAAGGSAASGPAIDPGERHPQGDELDLDAEFEEALATMDGGVTEKKPERTAVEAAFEELSGQRARRKAKEGSVDPSRRQADHAWEQEAGAVKSRRPDEAGALRWPRYLAALLVVLLAVGGAIWKIRQGAHTSEADTSERRQAAGSATLPVPGLPPYEEARALAVEFVTTADPERMLELIRPWPGAREAVTEFLAEHPPVEGAEEMLADMPPIIRPGLVHQSFGLVLPDGTGRLVEVIEGEDGPEVDFKAFIEWSSVSYDALFAGEVEEVEELRVIVKPSAYYNFEFSDSGKYLACEATPAGEAECIFIYLEVGSEAQEQIAAKVMRLGMCPITCSLRGIGESHKRRQFLLSGLKAIGFVVPDSPTED